VERFKKHVDLGRRWIRCGWRLFARNPWLLGGMGFWCAAAAVGLLQIPLIGGPLLGFLAPALVAAFYIAIEDVSKQKIKLPNALRVSAVKQSVREFLNVTRDERRLMQVLVMSLYGMIVVVLTDILMWFVAGTAIASPFSSLSAGAMITVMVALLLRFAIYALLSASLVFTLPLALLQDQALIPAMASSVRRVWDYLFALSVVVVLMLCPLLIGALISFYANWLGYLVGMLAAIFVLPISVCSFYCGYRTMFIAEHTNQPVGSPLRRANSVS